MVEYTINKKDFTFDLSDGRKIAIPEEDIGSLVGSRNRSVGANEAGQEYQKQLQEMNDQTLKGPLGSIVAGFLSLPRSSAIGNAAESTIDSYQALKNTYASSPREGQEKMGFLDRFLDNYYAYRDARNREGDRISLEFPVASTVGKGVGIGSDIAATWGASTPLQLAGVGAGLSVAGSQASILEPQKLIPEAALGAGLGYAAGKAGEFLGDAARFRANTQQSKQGIASSTARNALAQETADVANAARVAQNQASQQQFSKGIQKAADRIEKAVGKTGVRPQSLGVSRFIDDVVNTSPIAGSSEAGAVSKFLNTLFPNVEKISGANLGRVINSVDARIASEASEPVKAILTEFKGYMANEFPQAIAAQNIFEKYSPALIKDVSSVPVTLGQKSLESVPEATFGAVLNTNPPKFLKELRDIFRPIVTEAIDSNSGNLASAIDSGKILADISDLITNSRLMQRAATNLEQKLAVSPNSQSLQLMKQALDDVKNEFLQRAEREISKKSVNIRADQANKTYELQNLFQKVDGAPQLNTQQIMPQLEEIPSLPVAQTVADKTGQFFENATLGNVVDQIKKNAGGTTGGAAGIAALKYLGVPLSKTAAIGSGVAMAGRALTSPSMGGEIARQVIKRGPVAAYVQSVASQYPSYRDGVLLDPQDRRSVSIQLENDPQMKLSDKAVYQAKINRGIPLQDNLR